VVKNNLINKSVPNNATKQKGKKHLGVDLIKTPSLKKEAPHPVRRSGERVVYGRNTVTEILKHKSQIVEEIWLLKEGDEILEYVPHHRKDKIGIQLVERLFMDEVTDGGVHQGVVASLNHEHALSLSEFIKEMPPSGAVVLCASGINDPHNLGALFRAAECFGVDGVLYSRNRGTGLTPVVSKVAVGAAQLVRSVEVPNIARSLNEFKKAGYWIISAEVDDDSMTIDNLPSLDKVVLVMGEEGRGVGRLISEISDFKVTIPMHGVLDSLNVSQATAVLLYEIRRKKIS
jgi:23S rRNA (guanosine2251-2'-O)-methyltransferase